MKIEMIPIEKLKDSPSRARQKNLALLKRSISCFGFLSPILIDAKNVVVCGQMRLIAARELGIVEIPCIRLDLKEKEIAMFRLIDNKVSEKSNWEWVELDREILLMDEESRRFLKDFELDAEDYVHAKVTSLADMDTHIQFDFDM